MRESTGNWEDDGINSYWVWHQCGPRHENDMLHDMIVELIQELKLSGYLTTYGDGCSYHGQCCDFKEGIMISCEDDEETDAEEENGQQDGIEPHENQEFQQEKISIAERVKKRRRG